MNRFLEIYNNICQFSFLCYLSDDLSLSSDSLDDDSIDDSKTPSPEHTVPDSSNLDLIPPSTPHSVKVKEEPLDDVDVEDAAKELFGNDLLFNQDDLHTDEFWNELITSSEGSNLLVQDHSKMLGGEDLIEVETSIKMDTPNQTISSPSSNFFSSAVQPPTLAGF